MKHGFDLFLRAGCEYSRKRFIYNIAEKNELNYLKTLELENSICFDIGANIGLAVLDLSFEETVFETKNTLFKLEQFTGRKIHPRITSILKKQKIPRNTIAQGKGHASYGWVKNNKSEAEIYAELLEKVQVNCSAKQLDDLGKVITWYNDKYPSKLASFE
jgi:hypothetical protein